MAAIITTAVAQAQLDAWLAASLATATSQSYAIDVEGNKRELVRASAAEIRKNIDYWSQKVRELTRAGSGRSRTRYFVG